MKHILYIYISIYISLQIMNIWHYIHPHYRYDIQEMKIVLAKQLPFSFYLVIIVWFHIPSSRKCCISPSQWFWRSFHGTVTKKVPLKYFTSWILELKADRQSCRTWGHRCWDVSWKVWLEMGRKVSHSRNGLLTSSAGHVAVWSLQYAG